MINRRVTILGGAFILTSFVRTGAAKVLLQAEEFASRAFISKHRDPPEEGIRFVVSSTFRFSGTSDATLGVAHLANLREFEDRGEIYVINVSPIEDIPGRFGDRNWIVTYTVVAGVAAFETHHAHALFVTGNLLHEIEVTANDRTIASALVLQLADVVISTTDREPGLWGTLVDLEDVPDDLELYREIGSDGTFTGYGTPEPDQVPPWDRIQY